MQEDDLRASSNVEDRRGFSMGGAGAGGLGIGAIVVLTLIGWATGINPLVLINGAEQVTGGGQVAQQPAPVERGTPSDQMGQFVARILGETEDVWSQQLPAETGKQYEKPVLVLYLRGHAVRLRRRAVRDGPVLLPARPQAVSRYGVLPGHAAADGRRRRLRLRLRDRA